jgi:hypothetical protein
MKADDLSLSFSSSSGWTFFPRFLTLIFVGGMFLLGGCSDLRQKSLALVDSMIDCMDEIVVQLQGINSSESLQASLPKVQAAIDRLKEVGKEAMQLEREEGKILVDKETEKRYMSRMQEKGLALQREVQRISQIPGINPGDLMKLAQMFYSLRDLRFGGDATPPPPGVSGPTAPMPSPSGGDSDSSSPPPPPGGGAFQNLPPPPSGGNPSGSAPPPSASSDEDLKQKHQQLLDTSLSCFDAMIAQLRGVNSSDSLHAAIAGFQSAADRLKEVAKQETQFQRESFGYRPDPQMLSNYFNQVVEKGKSLAVELQRIAQIPGINPGDLMTIRQSLLSLKSMPSGGGFSPPPTGFGGPAPVVSGPAPSSGPGAGPAPDAAQSPPLTKTQNRPFSPEGFREDLQDLQSDWPPDREAALEHLTKAKPEDVKSKELRKQVAPAIKKIAFDEHASLESRRLAVQGLVVWGGKFSVPLLIKLLDDKSFYTFEHKTLFQALADLRDDRAIEPVAEKINGDPFGAEEAVRCLEVFGPKAEDALLKRPLPNFPQVTKKMVEFLGRYGTKKSLPQLRILQKHPSALFLQPELDQAIETINQRGKKAK